MPTATKVEDFTQFATEVYEQQEPEMRKDFIASLAQRLHRSIEQGEQDIKDGNVIDLDTMFKKIDELNFPR